MLPIVLVFCLAQSVFSAPSVSVSQYSINELAPPKDSGALFSSYVTESAFELLDGGEANIYILSLQQVLHDLANQPDPSSQAIALASTLATLGELATGVPGDACEASALIDAYASGNTAALAQAFGAYVGRLTSTIDLVTELANNPNSVRYSVGRTGNCAGGGRSYQFEAAWDGILNSANPYNIGLVNEAYCAAKRLYGALNSRSNNVGAAISAAALPPVTQLLQGALGPASNFLRAAASGGNPAGAAAAAKSALASAAASVRF